MDCAICYQNISKINYYCNCKGSIIYHQTCLISWVFKDEIKSKTLFNTTKTTKKCDICNQNYQFTIPTKKLLKIIDEKSDIKTIKINLEPLVDMSITIISFMIFIICIFNLSKSLEKLFSHDHTNRFYPS
jgi:E3 ubiquitin-protein ligase DOA10